MPRKITPVVLCESEGTRLWPAARSTKSKQFIPLFDHRSLFQETLRRVTGRDHFQRPIVIADEDARFIAGEQVRELDLACDFVLKPEARGSAPAISVAAMIAARSDPQALILVVRAEHIIGNDDAFNDACEEATACAASGVIVALGVEPDAASPSHSYLKPGRRIKNQVARRVSQVEDRPSAKKARRCRNEGWLWNSDTLIARADILRNALARYAPAVAAAAEAAVTHATRDLDFLRLDRDAYMRAPNTSIDETVLAKSKKAAVLSAHFGWADVRSWNTVHALAAQDADGNAVYGDAHLLETRNTLVRSEENMTAAVLGLNDAIVVTTQDAVLVTTRDRADEVDQLVETLRARQVKSATEHRRGHRPWGYYESVDESDRHKVKRIVVNPGAALSLQLHYHRSEHWVVVKGTAEVTCDETVTIVHENESIYLPQGCVHRLANPGKISLHLIEVQVGSYLEEDDIIRLEDRYNRGTDD
ncbi:MAG: mannose-1-phosphate guanylyltransferase/mannose-6-phosphate isomerase [Pseudomonadota bacterium]